MWKLDIHLRWEALGASTTHLVVGENVLVVEIMGISLSMQQLKLRSHL